MSRTTAKYIVGMWMPLIDRTLVTMGVPPENRWMHASHLFVENAISHFGSGETSIIPTEEMLQDFLFSESFREFFIVIQNWLSERYGEGILQYREWTLVSCLHFAGGFYLMNVPVLRAVERTDWIHSAEFAVEDAGAFHKLRG